MDFGRSADMSETITDPVSQFDEIAFLYDELMDGVPYSGWVEYIHRILGQFHFKPRTVLDLCCGTGTASILLAGEGYDVTGIDVSPAMVERARQKAAEKRLQIDFRVQDASSLRLGRRYDLIVSLFDSLNYILDAAALQNAFHRVSEHLQPGGLFVFDVNTELALAGRFFDQSNVGSGASVIYDWRSTYDYETRICSIRMSYIYRSCGAEKRIKIVHYQRAYGIEEISEMLKTAGFTVLAVYNGYTLKKATARSDRAFFIARRP